ncbi:PepSY-associated TM helix domain-containing protein [Persicobacter diffluens]|uniref:Iron-regulated protein n=1 Tax=Persicobacter diffluens TaxID=981 RepID=A0AAN4W220_9BACT|nr:iron-regulated protein [Persicobacter diffluens]
MGNKGFFSKLYKQFKAWHKYLGLALSVIILWMSVSGILLNHPDLIAELSVHKDWVPEEYTPQNWNRGVLSDALFLSGKHFFFAGKQGIWESQDGGATYQNASDKGFEPAPYYKKTNDLFLLPDQQKLLAATYGGLWLYDLKQEKWQRLAAGEYAREQFVKILQRKGELLAFSKSGLWVAPLDQPTAFHPRRLTQAGLEEMDLISFFFALHSGWLWGSGGRLVVDVIGLLLIFLTLGALLVFYIKQRKVKLSIRQKRWLSWNIRYHHQIGFASLFFLLVIGGTGLFMRPPLLGVLMDKAVGGHWLQTTVMVNPWYHSIRNATYIPETDELIIDTSKGLYQGPAEGQQPFEKAYWPAHIFPMGATVFDYKGDGDFLLGSFYGLHNVRQGDDFALDLLTQKPVYPEDWNFRPNRLMTTGFFIDPKGVAYLSAYGQGLLPMNPFLQSEYPMPAEIATEYRMPLWNFMFELHNARLFRPLLSKWVILVNPLLGIFFVVLCITGGYEYVWRRRKSWKSTLKKRLKR